METQTQGTKLQYHRTRVVHTHLPLTSSLPTPSTSPLVVLAWARHQPHLGSALGKKERAAGHNQKPQTMSYEEMERAEE